MPIYEYRCNNFSGHKEHYGHEQVHNFEVLQLSKDGVPKCPICDSTNVEYLPSAFAFRKSSQTIPREEKEEPRQRILEEFIEDGMRAASQSPTGIAKGVMLEQGSAGGIIETCATVVDKNKQRAAYTKRN